MSRCYSAAMPPKDILIQPPSFDPIVAVGIGGIALFMAAACVLVYSWGDRRRVMVLTIGVTLWMGLSALAALSGFLARFDMMPPPMLMMLVSVFVMSAVIGLSPFGRAVATEVPLLVLIGLQSFRLPLELVMHHAADRAIMPVQLSFSGYNFDIVTGVGAVLLVGLMKSKAPVATWTLWAWNLWGLWCLLVIAMIAVATSPVVRAFGDEPRNLNTWVLFFPYVWLPVVLVIIAISGHLIITRKLLQMRTLLL